MWACRYFVCILQDILKACSLKIIVKRSYVSYTITRWSFKFTSYSLNYHNVYFWNDETNNKMNEYCWYIIHACMKLKNEDGGWGLHIESSSYMFTTVLSYICIRILGGEDDVCVKARKWIIDRGGVTYIPSWGKTWLSVCFLYQFLLFLIKGTNTNSLITR